MIAKVSTGALRHWHPVLLSKQLNAAPVELTLCGTELVLFRTANGQPAALDSRCPHRKMRLALGCVKGDRLVCPYHGWSFQADGKGTSPGTHNISINTTSYQVREQHDVIWLRANISNDIPPPPLSFPGFFRIALLHHRVAAPFQLLIDNMSELEHSASVHSIFGFELSNLHQVKTRVNVTDAELNIYYEGPQRKMPAYLSIPTGIRENDLFVQYAKVRFGPVHTTYDLTWHKPDSDEQRALQLKFVIFFNPVTDTSCEQFTFAFAKSARPLVTHILRSSARHLLVKNIDKELRADIRLVESLRLQPSQYSEYRLSRFDRPIREAAAMIDSLYFDRALSQTHEPMLSVGYDYG